MAQDTGKPIKPEAPKADLKLYTVTAEAQRKIIGLAQAIMQQRSETTELHTKMEAIDVAYARYHGYKGLVQGLDATGRDVSREGEKSCGNVFDSDNVVAPVVVSQVDSYVAFLAEVFLSGYPLFPVVSPPQKRKLAEQLEVLIDDHALLGGYVRQLLLMLRDGIKYNISAIETSWEPIEQFTVEADYTNTKDGTKLKKDKKYFTKIKRLDMYNVIHDNNSKPGDVSAEGDFAGYIEILSKTKMKKLLISLKEEALNNNAALDSYKKLTDQKGSAWTGHYKQPPQISDYISPNVSKTGMDWGSWITATPNTGKNKEFINLYDGSHYEKFTFYARILPSDFDIKAPSSNTPQIWKFTVINMSVVIEATRVISAYDTLPILFGQPLEDGLGYQTQSVAEGAIPFQEAATTLFNIRFAAARRAVSDRALYDPDMISMKDINSKGASPKIPVRMKVLNNKTLDSAYKQVPFDMRGTETTISDAQTIVGFSQALHGLNNAQQGQFQKGNKSVQEFNDVQGNSDNRLRLPALVLEAQVFTPLKQIIALNIFQFGKDATIVSQRTGQEVNVNIQELRDAVLSFRIADGYSPKSKLASSDMITTGLQLIMNSPILQQAYRASLPGMFAHLMQLGGVRDLDQYDPAQQQQAEQANLNEAQLQSQANGQPGAVPIPSSSTPPSLPVA